MIRKRAGQASEEVKEVSTAIRKVKAKKNKSTNYFFHAVLLIIFILYVIIPLSVYLCPAVRRHAIFLNYVSLSQQKNLSLPSDSGLACTRHFYINSADSVRLGTWHVPPRSVLSRCKENALPLSDEFEGTRPVFLYLHGNAGTRSGSHRVELYKILSEKVDAHVVAFDYRGFGDSSNVSPTENGVVQDTEHVYNWLRERVNSSRIFVWGHSLGTGVGIAFLEMLSRIGKVPEPAGLILEAPFTSILEAAEYHPLSIFHRYMPFFETLIAKPLGDKDTGFDSLGRIGGVKTPLLILHAEDDGFVHFDLGKKLYEHAKNSRTSIPSPVTQFVGFDGKHDLGHKNIFKSPELPSIIRRFIDSVSSSL